MPDAGRIPEPAFAGDSGAADSALASALTAYADDPADASRNVDVVLALQAARLLVPVVAVRGQVEDGPGGLVRDTTSDMATALLTGRDGRRALLAFTSLAALATWRADARPVPVPARVAVRSALQEGAAALLVDVSGPTPYAVTGDVLSRLARGWTLSRTPQGLAWAATPDGSAEE